MEWKFEASFENWEAISEKVDEEFAANCVTASERRQLLMAAEEIVSNIIFYAGTEGKIPEIGLILEFGEMIVMEFVDDGEPFNPLEKPAPELTKDARAAVPGGLGIYMARRLTDEMAYEYKEGKNHLCIEKRREIKRK